MKIARILLSKGKTPSTTNNKNPKVLLFCIEPAMAILFKEETELFSIFTFYSDWYFLLHDTSSVSHLLSPVLETIRVKAWPGERRGRQCGYRISSWLP